MRQHATESDNQELKTVSSTLLLNYRPLVEMIMLSPDGQLIARQSMNEDIMDPFPDCVPASPELETYFLDLLEKTAQEAKTNS